MIHSNEFKLKELKQQLDTHSMNDHFRRKEWLDEDTYTKKQILSLISRGKFIQEDVFVLHVDHPIRLSFYDIVLAGKQLKEKDHQKIFELLLKRKTINAIANELGTYERDIFRKRKKMVAQIQYILNIRGITNHEGDE